MLRKDDRPIKRCGDCGNCHFEIGSEEEGFIGSWQCLAVIGGKIEDKNSILEACPLEDAGVKVGVAVMMVRGGKVLLGERSENCQTARNLYAYPGGRMDYGETIEGAGVREVFEETGITIDKKDLEFLRYRDEYFPENDRHYITFVFVARNFMGEPELKEPSKCNGWKWFSPDDIPENTFLPVVEGIKMFKDKM